MLDLIKRIVNSNEWLSGMADFRDGDLMALANQAEKFERMPKEHTSLSELFDDLNNYEGVFKYKNLLFFNDMQYGCFVYYVNKPDGYVEHLSIHAMNLKSFMKTVESLIG